MTLLFNISTPFFQFQTQPLRPRFKEFQKSLKLLINHRVVHNNWTLFPVFHRRKRSPTTPPAVNVSWKQNTFFKQYISEVIWRQAVYSEPTLNCSITAQHTQRKPGCSERDFDCLTPVVSFYSSVELLSPSPQGGISSLWVRVSMCPCPDLSVHVSSSLLPFLLCTIAFTGQFDQSETLKSAAYRRWRH